MTAHLVLGLSGLLQAQSLGLWVIRDQLVTKDKIDAFINFAKQNNFKDLFVQVRGRGDAFYKSSIVTFNDLLSDRSWDPLEYALHKAHAEGIKVHAWLNIFLLWSAEQKPRDQQHLLYIHPEWCAVDDDGVKDIQRPFSDFKKNNTEGIYLSPLLPEVRRYLIEIIREIAAKYDVDGIHLDYVRYPRSCYDYNVTGRLIFKEKYGIDPILLAITNKSILESLSEFNIPEYIAKWDDFRREAITDLVRSTHQVLSALPRSIKLSAAVKPDPDEARHFFYQDWENWLSQNYLEFVVIMNYAKSSEQFEAIFKKIDPQLPKERVWVGIGVYNQSPFDALTKTMLTINNNYQNIVFFSYETFQKNTAYFPVIRRAFSLTR